MISVAAKAGTLCGRNSPSFCTSLSRTWLTVYVRIDSAASIITPALRSTSSRAVLWSRSNDTQPDTARPRTNTRNSTRLNLSLNPMSPPDSSPRARWRQGSGHYRQIACRPKPRSRNERAILSDGAAAHRWGRFVNKARLAGGSDFRPAAVRAGGLGALGVQVQRMIANREPAILRHLDLTLLDLGVVELLDPPAGHAHQVIVVAALVQLEHRLARLEVVALEDAGVLELGQHAVDSGEADVQALAHEHPVDVLGREVPHLAALEELEDAKARPGRLQAARFQVVDVGHGIAMI